MARDPDPRMNVYAAPQRLVKIGRQRRLNVLVTGHGSPTIILNAGGIGSTLEWRRVQSRLATANRVVSYDRAGLGFSDPGPLPRTPSRSVKDLRAALTALDIEPPYILVGHSTGSLDVRLFAFQSPDQVVGIVLVDPRGDRLISRLSQVSPAFAELARSEWLKLRCRPFLARRKPAPGSTDYEALVFPPFPALTEEVNEAGRLRYLSPSFWRAALSEWNAAEGRSEDELRNAQRHLGDMPLIVLTAGRDPYSEFDKTRAEAISKEWRVMHEELVRLSSGGVRREVEDCGHYIPGERPDAVVDAVKDVLDLAAHRTS
jgi:pimeloyl-ACP methyl ester carboxylesterase